jgi:hypothetical protein
MFLLLVFIRFVIILNISVKELGPGYFYLVHHFSELHSGNLILIFHG